MTDIINYYSGETKYSDGNGKTGPTVNIASEPNRFNVSVDGLHSFLAFSQICPDYAKLRYTPEGIQALAQALSQLSGDRKDLRVFTY